MNRIYCALCAWSIGCSVWTGVQAGSALDYSALTLAHRPVTAPPSYSPLYEARHVFFLKESITFDLLIYSRATYTLQLRSASADVADAFTFRSTYNAKPVTLAMGVAPALHIEGVGRGGDPVAFSSVMMMPPGERLVFRWQLQEPEIQPGRYRVEVIPRMTDDAGRPVAPQASILDFEVRDLSTPQARADVDLRRAFSAYSSGDQAQAIRIIDALLRKNPRSYVALTFKGTILAHSNRAAAVRLWRAALALVEANADELCSE